MFCASCGEKLDENDKFCRNCGTRVSDQDSQEGSEADVPTPLRLEELPDGVNTIELSVISTVIEGREEGGPIILTVCFDVRNASNYDFSYIEIVFAVLSGDGTLLGELREIIDETLSSGDGSQFERSVFLDFTHLDEGEQELTLIISATASRPLVLEAGTVELSLDNYVLGYYGAQDVGTELRSLGGNVQIKKESEIEVIEGLFLIENNSGSFLPSVDLTLQASGPDGGVIASSTSSEPLGPYEIRSICTVKGFDASLTGVTAVDVTISAHMMCSAGRCVVLFGSNDGEVITSDFSHNEDEVKPFVEQPSTKKEYVGEEKTPRIRISASRSH